MAEKLFYPKGRRRKAQLATLSMFEADHEQGWVTEPVGALRVECGA